MHFQYGIRIAPSTRSWEDDDSWSYSDWDSDPYDDGHYYAPDDELDGGYCGYYDRLYIWRVCLNMIKERPLGFGWNGFIHHYMYYQADFLSTHPGTIFSVLADNVAFPYNEFLHTTIAFGIPGLVLLLFVIWDTLAPHTNSSKDLIVKSLLVNYLVFSSFSYPTDAIYTCLLFPILILLSRKGFLGPYVNILCGAIIVVATLLFIKRDTLERKIRNECFLYQEQRVDKLGLADIKAVKPSSLR